MCLQFFVLSLFPPSPPFWIVDWIPFFFRPLYRQHTQTKPKKFQLFHPNVALFSLFFFRLIRPSHLSSTAIWRSFTYTAMQSIRLFEIEKTTTTCLSLSHSILTNWNDMKMAACWRPSSCRPNRISNQVFFLITDDEIYPTKKSNNPGCVFCFVSFQVFHGRKNHTAKTNKIRHTEFTDTLGHTHSLRTKK